MSDTALQDVDVFLKPEHDPVSDRGIWRRLRRNVSISVIGSVLSIAIKLGQVVLLTKFLRIDDYGRVLIVINFCVFLDSFVGLRVADVMFRFFQPLKEMEDVRGLRNLLVLCLGICLTSGLLIYFGILSSSAWLATHVYSDSRLSPLFNLFGLTVLVSSFSGVYEPILRMYDRFSMIVVPQLLGSIVTLVIVSGYLLTLNGHEYDLRVVLGAFLVGHLFQSLPPLVRALHLVNPFFALSKSSKSLVNYRSDLIRCLLSSNFSGYLKFATSPGDIFLLGLFSSPTQVALYGLARQLTAPLAILQTTIQTAITPEIMLLRATNRLKQLQRLVTRFVVMAGVIGGSLLLPALVAARLVFEWFLAPQYSAALPAFYCLVIAGWLLLTLLVFRPLAVSLDLLNWHNLALSISVLLLCALIATNRLTFLTMAYVQLAEAAVLRVAFSLLVWNKLRNQSAVT